MKPKAIVFDLDWTLCEMKPDSERNNHTGDEKSIEQIVYLAQSLLQLDHIKVIVMTGRKSKYLLITISWLERHWIPVEIIMQTKWTAEKNHIYKEKELVKLQERYDIVAMVDDNPDLIPVCKKLGILLLQVHR